MGVTPPIVYRMLSSGKTTLRTLEQYANALDVPVWELMKSCGVTSAPPKVNDSNSAEVECPHCNEKFLLTLNASKL